MTELTRLLSGRRATGEVTTRLALPEDIHEIALLHDLLHGHAIGRDKILPGIATIIKDAEAGTCVVAEVGSRIVGVSELKAIHDTWDGNSPYGYVDNVSVLNEYQRSGCGVGSHLMTAMKQLALSQQMKRLRLFVDFDNPDFFGASRFYTKTKFFPRGLFMECRLDE